MSNMSESKSAPAPAAASGSIAIPKSKRGLKGYLNEVKREVKKVDWPTPRETTRLTGIVLAVCGMIVAILFALSTVVETLVNIIVHRGGPA